MADSTKTIIIGSMAVYRGTYTESTVYYKENVVTYYSCVFKAASNNFSGVPPINVGANGAITIVNTNYWTCIVDNTNIYNMALSCQNVDNKLSPYSENPIQNKAVYAKFNTLEETIIGMGGSAILITYFEDTDPIDGTINEGEYWYNNVTNKLFYGKKVEGELMPYMSDVTIEEVELTMNKLYVNFMTGNWFRWNGERLIGINQGVVTIEQMDNIIDVSNGAPAYYTVVKYNGAEYINIGTLQIIGHEDNLKYSQTLETFYTLDGDGNLDEESEEMHKYVRYLDMDLTNEWTKWETNGDGVKVDDELDAESNNAISNRAVSLGLEEFRSQMKESNGINIQYFSDYNEADNVQVSMIPYRGPGGVLVYLVKMDVFALYVNGTYYVEWFESDTIPAHTEFNVMTEDGYKSRPDRLFCYTIAAQSNMVNVDSKLNTESNNPISNKAVATEFQKKLPLTGGVSIESTDSNGVYHATCNITLENIINAFNEGRRIVLVETEVLKTNFTITQVPIDTNNNTICVAVGNGYIYQIDFADNEITISKCVSGGSESREVFLVTYTITGSTTPGYEVITEDTVFSGVLDKTIGEIIEAFNANKLVIIQETIYWKTSAIVNQCPLEYDENVGDNYYISLAIVPLDGWIYEIRYHLGTVYFRPISRNLKCDKELDILSNMPVENMAVAHAINEINKRFENMAKAEEASGSQAIYNPNVVVPEDQQINPENMDISQISELDSVNKALDEANKSNAVLQENLKELSNQVESLKTKLQELEQEPVVIKPFSAVDCNDGVITINKKPEEITVNDVRNALTIPALDAELPVITSASNIPESGQYILTGEAAGFQEGDSITIKKANNTLLDSLIKSTGTYANCAGLKLSQVYYIYMGFSGSSIPKQHQIEKDFTIDGEVDGEATGGFNTNYQFFSTKHSLNLRKAIFTTSSNNGYARIGVDITKGVDQLQVVGCQFNIPNYKGRAIHIAGTTISLKTLTVREDANGQDEYVNGITLDEANAYVNKYNSPLDELGYEKVATTEAIDPIGAEVGINIKDPNVINHVLIADNTIDHGMDFVNIATSVRVAKSMRIIGNTVNEAASTCIYAGATGDGMRQYTSCPYYIVGNTILGQQKVARNEEGYITYYCPALIEQRAIYMLHNTLSNYVAAIGFPDGKPAQYQNYPTYDLYANSTNVFFCNNVLSNFVRFTTYRGNFGTLKAKGNCVPSQYKALQHKSVTRYYYGNTYSVNEQQVKGWWTNRTGIEKYQDYESSIDPDKYLCLGIGYTTSDINEIVFNNNVVNYPVLENANSLSADRISFFNNQFSATSWNWQIDLNDPPLILGKLKAESYVGIRNNTFLVDEMQTLWLCYIGKKNSTAENFPIADISSNVLPEGVILKGIIGTESVSFSNRDAESVLEVATENDKPAEAAPGDLIYVTATDKYYKCVSGSPCSMNLKIHSSVPSSETMNVVLNETYNLRINENETLAVSLSGRFNTREQLMDAFHNALVENGYITKKIIGGQSSGSLLYYLVFKSKTNGKSKWTVTSSRLTAETAGKAHFFTAANANPAISIQMHYAGFDYWRPQPGEDTTWEEYEPDDLEN